MISPLFSPFEELPDITEEIQRLHPQQQKLDSDLERGETNALLTQGFITMHPNRKQMKRKNKLC